jgi:hypothetical protein
MQTLDLSEVSDTSKILSYLANHSIQNKVFYILVKHIPQKKYYDILQYHNFYLKTLKILYFQTLTLYFQTTHEPPVAFAN